MSHYAIQTSGGREQVMALLADGDGRLWIWHAGAGLIEVRLADFGVLNDKRMFNGQSDVLPARTGG
ncbi:MAG TPA: hypothetical protein VKN18_13465 [Blastocatellia bacterium]|nr:hypothetical protein [Blastocatellia bacterium]